MVANITSSMFLKWAKSPGIAGILIPGCTLGSSGEIRKIFPRDSDLIGLQGGPPTAFSKRCSSVSTTTEISNTLVYPVVPQSVG